MHHQWGGARSVLGVSLLLSSASRRLLLYTCIDNPTEQPNNQPCTTHRPTGGHTCTCMHARLSSISCLSAARSRVRRTINTRPITTKSLLLSSRFRLVATPASQSLSLVVWFVPVILTTAVSVRLANSRSSSTAERGERTKKPRLDGFWAATRES